MHLVGRTLAVAVGLVLGGVLIETITSSVATGPATIRIIPDRQTSISRIESGGAVGAPVTWRS